jgi:nuclear pore complex protein Nup205
MIESLLLLLWRHLLFYANEAGNNNVHPRNLSSSLAYSTQMGSTRGASRDTLNRVAMSLGGVMDAINVDRQVPEELRPDGSQGSEYRRILVRRLREMITALTDA